MWERHPCQSGNLPKVWSKTGWVSYQIREEPSCRSGSCLLPWRARFPQVLPWEIRYGSVLPLILLDLHSDDCGILREHFIPFNDRRTIWQEVWIAAQRTVYYSVQHVGRWDGSLRWGRGWRRERRNPSDALAK